MDEKAKLSEGEKLYNLTQSDDWKLFKDRFEDVILTLADIRNVPFSVDDGQNKTYLSAEQRTYEMQVRERTLLMLQQIMNGVLADVEEYTEMMDTLKEGKRETGDFIIRFE